MSFEVSAEAYDAFMGGFSEPLSDEFLAFAGVPEGGRVLDVGCGPGALTRRLIDRLGIQSVAAVDPSASFVDAVRARFPGLDARRASAEELPFADASVDAALAQLVVHFMPDPVAGLREMARVCRPGGVVAACVWDHADGGGPLAGYWAAVREFDPDADDEADLPGSREGDLIHLATAAGLVDVTGGRVSISRRYASFQEWWEPYTYGIGPAGAYVRSLDAAAVDRLRGLCAARLPAAPFEIRASAWGVRGRVAGSRSRAVPKSAA
ncbi:MAG: class I SAM-dependent methyltransferase [Micrococcales bacterium]|nr:class I SAM-dependent methyltransferase [Micrococcales bacterium]